MEMKREEVGGVNDKLYQALRNKEEMKKEEITGNTYDTYVEPEEIEDDGSGNALTGTVSLL